MCLNLRKQIAYVELRFKCETSCIKHSQSRSVPHSRLGVMATDDTGGLFEAAAGSAATAAADAAPGAKRQKPNEKEKRILLRPWDQTAAQVLNPYGKSFMNDLSQAELWKAAAEGSAKARFHTELAATAETGGVYRVGLGLSRTAETIQAAIEELQNNTDIANLLNEEPLQAARMEAAALEPFLRILNAGKGRQSGTDGATTGFNRARNEKAKHKDVPKYSQAEVEDAAREIHGWLCKPESALRGVLSILSTGGVFYTANIAEKLGRAWVAQKPASASDAAAAAVARASGAGILIFQQFLD